jgi:hypothetical protein
MSGELDEREEAPPPPESDVTRSGDVAGESHEQDDGWIDGEVDSMEAQGAVRDQPRSEVEEEHPDEVEPLVEEVEPTVEEVEPTVEEVEPTVEEVEPTVEEVEPTVEEQEPTVEEQEPLEGEREAPAEEAAHEQTSERIQELLDPPSDAPAEEHDDGWIDGESQPPADTRGSDAPTPKEQRSLEAEEPVDGSVPHESSGAALDRVLEENSEFFDREAERLRDQGDLEAAATYAEWAERARDLLGGGAQAESDEDGGWIDGELPPEVSDAEQTRQLAENQQFFDREAERLRAEGDLDAAAAHAEASARIQELFVADLPESARARLSAADLAAMEGPLSYETVAQEDMTLVAFNTSNADPRWCTTMEEAQNLGAMDSVYEIKAAMAQSFGVTDSIDEIKAAITRAHDEGREIDTELLGDALCYVNERSGDLDSPDMTERLALAADYSGTKTEPFRPRDTVYVWQIKKGEPIEYIRSTVAPQTSGIDDRMDPHRRMPGGAVQYYRLGPLPQRVERRELGEIRALDPSDTTGKSDRVTHSTPGDHRKSP